MPEWEGDDNRILEFIYDNLNYPESAAERQIQGKVVVRFLVDAVGAVTEPEIYSGIDSELDAEAIRLIWMFPKFEPAVKNGIPVACYMYWPILFRLKNDKIRK